jgi:BirA family transcriptional regulator, biotin operon repressor / biotin---[acetyl-CoA-carboxylase] ligase
LPQPLALNPLGIPFIELQSVDSTNNYALERVHAGLTQHGETFFAHEQMAGKGQWGRVWSSEKDTNIILSVVVKPAPLQLAQQFQLSACVSVAVREFFARYGGDATSIKWPNDLYWQDRKAGGILIESVIGSRDPIIIGSRPDNYRVGSWEWSVIGIGININQTYFGELVNPVSLKQITGRHFDTVEVAKELCRLLDSYFRQLIAGDFSTIYLQYLSHLYKRNETVRLKKDSRIFEAVIKNVSPTGRLVVQHAIEEDFDFGEIEWVK